MVQFLTRDRAAAHLTARGIDTTSQALADLAHRGNGPRYAIIRGRAVYRLDDLDTWLSKFFECDTTEAA